MKPIKLLTTALKPTTELLQFLNKNMGCYSINEIEDYSIIADTPYVEDIANLSTLNLLCLKLDPLYNRLRFTSACTIPFGAFRSVGMPDMVHSRLSYLRITDKGTLVFKHSLSNQEFEILRYPN